MAFIRVFGEATVKTLSSSRCTEYTCGLRCWPGKHGNGGNGSKTKFQRSISRLVPGVRLLHLEWLRLPPFKKTESCSADLMMTTYLGKRAMTRKDDASADADLIWRLKKKKRWRLNFHFASSFGLFARAMLYAFLMDSPWITTYTNKWAAIPSRGSTNEPTALCFALRYLLPAHAPPDTQIRSPDPRQPAPAWRADTKAWRQGLLLMDTYILPVIVALHALLAWPV